MTIRLPDEQWAIIWAFLQDYQGIYLGTERQCRRFVEGVLWILRSGAQWRLLPAQYGKWNTLYKRFMRWCEKGVWEALLAHVAADPDREALMLDSTIIRAHPCAAGAPKKEAARLPRRWDEAEADSAPKSM